jgi:hypothetical protein
MAGMLNEAMIPWLIMFFVIFIAVSIIWKLIVGSRPKTQPLTKNQFERLLSDRITSCKLNRNKTQKWVNITGDSTHPQIKHYARIIGANADARMAEILWRVKWYTPKRLNFIPWGLIDNWDGREVWINCNGTQKDGYFFRALISRDHVKGIQLTVEKYDKQYLTYLQYLLDFQATQDMMEQGSYEVITAASHKERPITDLMTKPEYQMYEESDRDMPVEPEG